MRFSSARYITLCQQTLVAAAVLAVGVSGAGVTTLQIVPQRDDTSREATGMTLVDAVPVTPEVREVRVTGISEEAPGAVPAPRAQRKGARLAAESEAPKELVAVSDPEPVTGYATVGVTWKPGEEYAEDQVAVQVRTEKDGAWSEWIDAEYHDEHGPDAGSAEAQTGDDRPGTDALVVGDVDHVQMRAETRDGSAPAGLKLAVIDPGTGTTTMAAPAIDTSQLPGAESVPDAAAASSTDASTDSAGTFQASGSGEAQDTAVLSAMKVSAKPRIYSRAQWGANERLRERGRPSYGTVRAGFIHHTVNANNYTSSQVPSLLRGIYAYHTQSRGWRDIGYNYLVDRFGRIWEGRYGGVDKPVVGAHTAGYNEASFAMSAIGNYDTTAPSRAVLSAYARLFAWKLSLYDIPANATRVSVKGRRMPAINGHRDVGSTACPGRYLYSRLSTVRTLARRVQNRAQSTVVMRRWRAIGGYRSVVGAPTGKEYSIAGGRARHFEKGRIYAKRGVGAYELRGRVLRAYKRQGGAAKSRLGFPRTASARFKRGTYARFENGIIKVYRSGRVRVVYSSR